MFDITTLAAAFDPATAELVRTAFMATAMVASSLCALALLPWTDAEIDEVDTAARRAVARLAPAEEPTARVTIQ